MKLERKDDKEAGIVRIRRVRTEITDELLGVIVYQSTLLYSLLNCGKVVVSQYHVSSKLGNVRAAAHCHTNIGLFQGRCIIHAITGLGYNVRNADDITNKQLTIATTSPRPCRRSTNSALWFGSVRLKREAFLTAMIFSA